MRISETIHHFKGRKPLIQIVLDGWGNGAKDKGDAIHLARTPIMDGLLARYAHTTVLTHGPYVGLPSLTDIGGSEVGHLTMGAGKIFPQGPTRLKKLIESGDFFRSRPLGEVIGNCLAHRTALHLIGLLSDGNVHSHISHFHELIRYAAAQGVTRLYLHALLDGRDVPYQSAAAYIQAIEDQFKQINQAHPGYDYAIASGGGREVITMDRDHNWPKVARGWAVHVHGQQGEFHPSALAAVEAFRRSHPDKADQDAPPFVVVRNGKPVGPIQDGDSVIFMNFRGDRAIEFTEAMVRDDFSGFDRGFRPKVVYAGMAVYDEDTNMPPRQLMEPASVENPFGKRILELGLNQFRLAETQKYAHVTFFFNGGYRDPLDKGHETYTLIPSDRVESFAQAPAMKAHEIGQKAQEYIQSGKYDFGLINFANADMVGHTGDIPAAIQAAEAVDQALGPLLQAVEKAGGVALISADHGNADEMIAINPKTGKEEPNTKHSINPVPVIIFDPAYQGPQSYRLCPSTQEAPNTLARLAATAFILMGLTPPSDIEPSLFDFSA